MKKYHTQYADDLWTFSEATQTNLTKTFDIINKFSQQAGLEINYNKTEIIRIDSARHAIAQLYVDLPIQWSDKTKILGIHIFEDLSKTIEYNYQQLYERLCKILKTWENRTLTLIGKIQVINSLVIPTAIHIFTVLPAPKTFPFFEKLKQKIIQFIWNGKKPKIKYTTLIQKKYDGGLALVDPETKHQSVRMSGISKLGGLDPPYWEKVEFAHLLMMNVSPKGLQKQVNIAPLWRDIFQVYAKYTNNNPTNKLDILTQYLWFNQFILGNKKMLYYKDFIKYGILQVKHVYCIDEVRFYRYEEIQQMYNPNVKYLEYYSVIKAIPNEWIAKLKSSKKCETDLPCTYYEEIFNLKKQSRWWYHTILRQKYQHVDLARNKWELELGKIIEPNSWQTIRITVFKNLINTKYQSFQFRLLSHRIITNYTRSFYDKNVSPTCSFCQSDIEIPMHLFWECQVVKKLLSALERWIGYILRIPLKIDKAEFMLSSYVGQYASLINAMYTVTKQYVYASKCLGNKLNFCNLISKFRNVYEDEKFNAFENNLLSKFAKTWYPYRKYVLSREI